MANNLCPEKLLPFNNVMAKLNNTPNEKGTDLGFREFVKGDGENQPWKMQLHGSNAMFNMISVDFGVVFQKKADIDKLKVALKAIIPIFKKAASRLSL